MNCSAWNFDGGDCDANPSCLVTTPTVPATNCTHYSCLDSVTCVDYYVIDYNWVSDGFCDLALNCSTYQLDGGDCDYGGGSSGSSGSSGDDYFSDSCSNYACGSYYNGSMCVDQYLQWDWIGDGFCDSALNCHAYGHDGGDCDSGSLLDDDFWGPSDDFGAVNLPTGFVDQCLLKSGKASCAMNPASGSYELTWSQHYGTSCTSSDMISSFSSASVIPAGTGFLNIGECISYLAYIGAMASGSGGGTDDLSSLMGMMYLQISCDASGGMMGIYNEPTCSVALATEPLVDECSSEYSCISSDSSMSNIIGLSMQGNVVDGSCSAISNEVSAATVRSEATKRIPRLAANTFCSL